MRVLLISPSGVAGGAERALAGLARRLPALGVEPVAVMLEPGPLEGWLAAAGCPVEVLDSGRTRQLHRTGVTLARLARRARDVDVVISNQSKGHVYGGLAAMVARRPAVWWQQGIPERSPIEVTAAQVPATAIVASSADAVDAQRRLTPGRRVDLVHLGIDLDAVRAAAGTGMGLREECGWGSRPVVGIVGRLQPWKGQEVFLRAMAEVARSHPDAAFAVIGGAVLGWEGDYPDRLRALADELGIAERVRFAGHQDNVYPWFDALDVVVHASFGEPFGLVLVEAMALGRPVVATAAGGPVEVIDDGVSGILVPPGDHDAMSAAVSKLLDDGPMRAAISAGARARSEHFSDRSMAEAFGLIVRQVAPLRGSAGSVPSHQELEERTVPGLHDFVFDRALSEVRGKRAVDLGANSGAFAARLVEAGLEVLAVDLSADRLGADVPLLALDLNAPDWAGSLDPGTWNLVTAIEVIEHLESPVAFLRNVGRLLAPDGVAVVTTPNVDSLPARVKFLLRGRLRMLDEHGDPTHISPIFWDLLTRQYLPLAHLELVRSMTYPPGGFVVGRPGYARAMRLARRSLARRPRLTGDNHVMVLRRAPQPAVRHSGPALTCSDGLGG